MSCKFCDGSAMLLEREMKLMSYKSDIYPGMDVYIDEDTLYIEVTPDTYEPSYIESKCKINFCPMCGRKLTDKTESE